jgi:non-ribosomal peptide synthetase component E (peptide arylation enzyme)
MVPDTIAFLPRLPTTSTAKVDYRRLAPRSRDAG